MYVSLLPKNIVCDTVEGDKHRRKQSSGRLVLETFAGIQKYQKRKINTQDLNFMP